MCTRVGSAELVLPLLGQGWTWTNQALGRDPGLFRTHRSAGGALWKVWNPGPARRSLHCEGVTPGQGRPGKGAPSLGGAEKKRTGRGPFSAVLKYRGGRLPLPLA